jgi:hypothetical protein
MSTKPSTQNVNNLGYRYRPSSQTVKLKPTLNEHGLEIGDSTPVALPVRLPTLEQRLQRYEAAGEARQAYYDAYFDPVTGQFADGMHPDDFDDDFDDIPSEGLSPYEEKNTYDRYDDRPTKKPKKTKSDIVDALRELINGQEQGGGANSAHNAKLATPPPASDSKNTENP